MATKEHIALINQGVDAWYPENPAIWPNLSGADRLRAQAIMMTKVIIFAKFIIICLAILAPIWSFRTFPRFMIGAFLISTSFMVTSIFAYKFFKFRRRREKSVPKQVAKFLEIGDLLWANKFAIIVSVALVGSSITSSVAYIIINHMEFILEFHRSTWMIFAAPMLGGLLYYFKGTAQVWYGLFEIIVSIIGAWFSVSQPWSNVLYSSVGLLSSIYITVRGLDNVEKGLPPEFHELREVWNWCFPQRKQEVTHPRQGSTPPGNGLL